MNMLLAFIVEKTITNSVPILIGVSLFAMLFGNRLSDLGVSKRSKGIIYSIVGTVSGLWAYSSFNIPDRSIELLEALLLGSGFFIFTLGFVALIAWFKGRKGDAYKRQ